MRCCALCPALLRSTTFFTSWTPRCTDRATCPVLQILTSPTLHQLRRNAKRTPWVLKELKVRWRQVAQMALQVTQWNCLMIPPLWSLETSPPPVQMTEGARPTRLESRMRSWITFRRQSKCFLETARTVKVSSALRLYIFLGASFGVVPSLCVHRGLTTLTSTRTYVCSICLPRGRSGWNHAGDRVLRVNGRADFRAGGCVHACATGSQLRELS